MSDVQSWAELTDFDFALAEARTNWHHAIYAVSKWPKMPEYLKRGSEEFKTIDAKIERQHQFLTDADSFEISRVLFQLEVHGPRTMKDMTNLLKRNNAALQDCLEDQDFTRRTRIKEERLQDMMLSDATIRNAAMLVEIEKRPVLNASVLASLMCRIAGKSKIDACLGALEQAELVSMKPIGPNNAKVIVDWSPLNAAFADYLEAVRSVIDSRSTQ